MNDQKTEVQVNKASLAEQSYEVLKERIIDLEIKPGERIDIDAIRDEFEVSRAPIRDALQRLVDKGLVEVKPRVGYFAVKLTPKEIRDIYEIRKLFETYVLRKAIDKIPYIELERLQKESLELQEDEIPEEELRIRFDKTDEILHQDLILKNANNELLLDFTERINNLISITRHLNERIGEAIDEHLAIVEALFAKDPDKSTGALEMHLDNVQKEIIRLLEKNQARINKRG